MHQKQKHIYVGLDLHKSTHTAVILDCWNKKLCEITIENKPSEFPRLMKEIEKYSKKLEPIYGLEDVGGNGRSLAVFLVEHKQIVKEVNSSLSCSLRRSRPTVQKDDSWDAECIAKVLISNLDELPNANPQDFYWTLSQLVLRRNAIVKSTIMLLNQLHTQLSYSYPSYKSFFSKIEGQCALEFWKKYPAPHYLKDVTVEELKEFLLEASSKSLSIRKAKQILDLVNKDGDTKREYQEQRDFLVKSIVRDIKFKKQEIEKVEVELKTVMNMLELKLDSMCGIDTVTAAAIMAEIGDIRRFKNAEKLACFAGIAPVRFGSGGKYKNVKSRQGNRTLHSIVYFLAMRQIGTTRGSKTPINPVMYEYYKKKVSQGKTKGQALVCVMRRLITILYAMIKNKTAYNMPEIQEEKAV